MTWIQTASGRAFDLINPSPEDVDFEIDIPEALARIARFTGHIRSGPYSVAQHCVIGADAIMKRFDVETAAAFLLHDAHEAYIGDIATPVAAAIVERVADEYTGRARVPAKIALTKFKADIDAAIHTAARVSWPLPQETEKIVKEYDLRMLATERLHLLGPSPRAWNPEHDAAEPLNLRGRLDTWSWPRAADEYRSRLVAYLPHLPRLGLPHRRVS
jgi:hypothetical protein